MHSVDSSQISSSEDNLQRFKESAVLYGALRFNTVCTTAHRLSLSRASSIQSMPPSHLLEIHFYIIHPSTPRSSECSFFSPQVSPPNPCTHFNSNKSPTRSNNFPVYSPDVYLQFNMFRAFSRPSSGAQ